MAAHSLSITKASFSASLLRPDVTKISRDEFNQFYHSFVSVTTSCSTRTIQTCKRWLLDHILVSPQRSNAFAKFLRSFSQHTSSENGSSSVSRQRLHILYLIHDLRHHTKHHSSSHDLQNHLTNCLESVLVDLVGLAAVGTTSKLRGKLHELVKRWRAERFFDDEILDNVEKTILDGMQTENNDPHKVLSRDLKELPYSMPASHGDSSTPYYDLPAANFMPHIIPNSAVPMQPAQIKALKFHAGPADKSLVIAVRDFLRDVETIDDSFQRMDQNDGADMDEIGQITYRDEAGQIVGDTYYGWSRAFCEKMRNRKSGIDTTKRLSRSSSRRHSSSRSRSLSSDDGARKRRYSSSSSRNSSRSPRRSASGRASQNDRRPDIKFARGTETGRSTDITVLASNFPTQPSYHPLHNGHGLSKPPYNVPVSHLPPPQPSAFGLALPPRPPNWNGPWPPLPPPPAPPIAQPFSSANNQSYMMPFPPPGKFHHQPP